MPISVYNLNQARRSYGAHGFSRQNHFRLLKLGPERFSSKILRGIHYISTATVPGLTIEPKEVSFMGTPMFEPGQMKFGNSWPVEFRTAGDFLVRNAIEEWSFAIRNPLTGKGSTCVNSNDSSIELGIVNDKGVLVRCYTLYGVFPTEVGEISYDLTSDEITTFSTTFQYQYWCPTDCDGLLGQELEDVGVEVGIADKQSVFDQYEDFISRNDSGDGTCEF